MKRIKLVALTALVLFSSLFVQAQSNQPATNTSIITELKALIQNKMKATHLVGVGVVLILNDTVAWKEGFGYADKEDKIPFTTSTAMAIGSVTKTFTAMGIMQLHEKQLLDVEKPLAVYLPQFKIKEGRFNANDITVQSVIHHTSGLPRDFVLNIWNKNEKYTNTVKDIKDEMLAFPANMVFHYSNIGYTLLGHTIFKVSNVDYPIYIQKNILKPIGMNNSGFYGSSSIQHISKTYDTLGVYKPLKIGRDLPAGALFSTIDDMGRYVQEIISIYYGKKGGVLKPETLQLLKTENAPNIENINTSVGWDVFKNDSCLSISHFGSYHLTNALAAVDLKHKNAVVLLANTVGAMDLLGEVLGKFQDISGVTPADLVRSEQPKVGISKDTTEGWQSKHTGMYVNMDQVHVLKYENDKLRLNSPFGMFLLKPISDDVFIPGVVVTADSIRWLKKSRFVFEEIRGYKLLFWQDANHKRQLMGQLVTPQKVNDTWNKRLGVYEIDGVKLESWEQYYKFELSLANNNLLQLKVYCSTGEYLYYMDIRNDDELVICGFGESGGETVRFYKKGNSDMMRYLGLPIKKINSK